jgi:hypothetical protein
MGVRPFPENVIVGRPESARPISSARSHQPGMTRRGAEQIAAIAPE